MKPVCCDTSFLVSLYGRDAHTTRASVYARSLQQTLLISPYNEFEFEQALRFLVWRGKFTFAEVARYQATFRADCNRGRLVLANVNLSAVLIEARRLSASYTMSEGYRTFDIFQVAAALELGAGEFLTFDLNQRKLARAEKLKTNP